MTTKVQAIVKTFGTPLVYTLGVAPTSTLRKHIFSFEQSTAARTVAPADRMKLRRFREFHGGAASWDRVARSVARVKAWFAGTDTRFVVTSLGGLSGRAVY